MSDLIVEILGKKIGEPNARCLVGAGLLDSTLFQYRHPINTKIARLLYELPLLSRIQFGAVKPDVRSLELLNNTIFAKRKDVTLRVFSHSNFWADIRFLQYLPDVERFDWDVDVPGSVEPLGSLKRLIHLGLGLSQPKPKFDLKFLLDFRNTLESLSLAGDYKNLREVVPQLSRLRSAWFVSTKLPDFEFLADLPIETLGNYGSRVQSFDFVNKLKNLRRLWLKTNVRLENLDFIERLSNLEKIELFFLAKLTKFPNCEHLKKLKLVLAYECNRLADISELLKLSGVMISVNGKAVPNRSFQTHDFTWSHALRVSDRVL